MLRVGVLLPPLPDGPPTLDVPVGGLEAGQQRGWIGGEERRDEHRVARQLVERVEGTAPRSPLPNLRQPYARRAHVDPERQQFRHTGGRRDPLEPFVPYPLGRELRQALHVRLRRLQRPGVDPELEARAEAQRPQNPQVVFLEPPVGVPHRADQLVLEIVGAVKRIAPFVPDGVVRDGVDREVPARQVIHQRHAELHHRVPPVGLDVLAERGDLVLAVVLVEHRNGAMLDSHRHRALEQPAYLAGRRRGRQVEVVILDAQQVVADRAPDAPRLVARAFQLLGDLQDGVGDRQPGGKLHALPYPSRITAAAATPALWVSVTCSCFTPRARARSAACPLNARRGAPPSARCTSTCRNDTPWLHPVPSALKHASLAAKRAASASALSARPAQSLRSAAVKTRSSNVAWSASSSRTFATSTTSRPMPTIIRRARSPRSR